MVDPCRCSWRSRQAAPRYRPATHSRPWCRPAAQRGVGAEATLDPEAEGAPFLDDVTGIKRTHCHRAGDAVRCSIGALGDVDAAEKIGIDEGAVGDTLVALIDGRRVACAINGDGNAAHALHAADVDVDGAGPVARLAGHDAGGAAEDVGRARPTEAIDVFLGDECGRRRRLIGRIDRVDACAPNGDRLEHRSPTVRAHRMCAGDALRDRDGPALQTMGQAASRQKLRERLRRCDRPADRGRRFSHRQRRGIGELQAGLPRKRRQRRGQRLCWDVEGDDAGLSRPCLLRHNRRCHLN